jgi:chromosome segregation ATPase|tara:strand:+ start:1566 stop:1946 length:381 start_codon:yes stop_codon:yes gene_type:complete
MVINDNKIKKVDIFLKKIGMGKPLSPKYEEEGENHTALLTDALEDLKKEMGHLYNEKRDLENSLVQTGEDMNLTRSEESRLRKKLSSLANKESEIGSKKVELEEKLKRLNFKMSKVSKIKDELKDL